ncbi:MAG TPA: phage holin family protein [Dongiaceae bacterium]|nr:phage holin family protein [Dongiaceae bacterium]
MVQSAWKLPIRLVPRRGQQIGMLIFSLVFGGFAVFWMAGAAGILDMDNMTINWPQSGDWGSYLFALFGLPFLAIGGGGAVVALMKMRRNSPHFHLQIHGEGLVIKSLFKLRRYDWSKLPAFETVRVERKTKNGTRVSYYTVASENTLAPPDAPRSASYSREVVRIMADEYGAKNGKDDADALTAWFNQLRDQARDGRLGPNEVVNVPEPFQATAISVTETPRGPLAGRSAPVIQAGARTQRPPTVDRG